MKLEHARAVDKPSMFMMVYDLFFMKCRKAMMTKFLIIYVVYCFTGNANYQANYYLLLSLKFDQIITRLTDAERVYPLPRH